MPLTFPLRSERLDLRPFGASDLEAAHRVYGDAEVMRHVGEGGAVGREDSATMIAAYREHQARHGFAFWAVIERASGQLIGDAGLEVTAEGVELGYTLARAWWGQGLATEAAQRCVQAAFGPLGLTRLVAVVDPANPASAGVLGRLGFREERVVTAHGRPHRLFALPRPAPSPRRRGQSK